jgi:LysM repeat protein
MNKRSSATARIAAAATLAIAFVVAVVVISGALGGGDSDGSGERQQGQTTQRSDAEKRKTPATYVVKSGDTLIAIAQETGVPVAEIQALNPNVDPQILIAGETLKLR